MAKSERPGPFEEIVLLSVARLGDEGYGVTILREIEQCTGDEPALGAIYATLERLETRGWVTVVALVSLVIGIVVRARQP